MTSGSPQPACTTPAPSSSAPFAGLRALGAAGLSWRPAARRWAVTRDLSVNYMVWAGRDGP